jgi:hypothetical protein
VSNQTSIRTAPDCATMPLVAAPEQSDAAITDELPDAKGNREDPGLPLEPERDSDTTPP